MRHRLQWFMHLRAHGLSNGDEHLAYTLYGVWHTFTSERHEAMQCRINHVADVANATGLRPQVGLWK